jgi:tetratricopeptide (TPR) repeat protein
MQNFIWKNPKSLWIYAAEKAPDQLRIHHNLGRYYQEHGFKEEAISEYKKALISPGLNRKNEVFITYYNLGKIYNVLKDYEKALYYYNRALYVNPDFPPIYNDIAAVFDGKGDYDIANKYLVKAIRLHPGSIEANFNVGLSYLREGQPEKAIRHFQRVSGEKQFDERVSLYLGIAFKQKDQLGRALTYFNMAIKENPRNIKPYLHLAEVFYRTHFRKF